MASKSPTRKAPAFLCYAEDAYVGTAGMHPAARGIYWQLMLYQWSHGCIPGDEDKLRQVACAPPACFDEHWPVVEAKLSQRADGNWEQPRLAAQARQSEARAHAGSKGGSKRGSKTASKAVSKGEANPQAKPKQNRPPPHRGIGVGIGNGNQEIENCLAELPAEFRCAEFDELVAELIEHREELGGSSSRALIANLKAFRENGLRWSVEAMRHTIDSGWKRLVHPGEGGKSDDVDDSDWDLGPEDES